MTNQPKQRGGKRAGSGRKKTGRINRVISITLPPILLGSIDRKRGKTSRSGFIAKRMDESLNQ